MNYLVNDDNAFADFSDKVARLGSCELDQFIDELEGVGNDY